MAAPTTLTPEQQIQIDQGTMVGGSEVHHALNLDPYGCDRFLIYKKRPDLYRPSHPFHGNFATERGTKLEAIAAQEYASRTGRQIRRVAGGLAGLAKRHPDFGYIGCHADYEIVNDERGPGLLSIKVPGERMFQKVKQTGTPDYWRLQLQYEMHVWGRKWASFGVFWADGWAMLPPFDYEYDPELARVACEGVHLFWAKLENGPLPERKKPTDARCRKCPYRGPCQGEALLDLMRKEGEDPAAVDVPKDSSPVLTELVQIHEERKELRDEAEALYDEAKETLKAYLGDQPALQAPNGRISYRAAVKTSFQGTAFRKRAADLAGQAKRLRAALAAEEPGWNKDNYDLVLAMGLLLETIEGLPGELDTRFTTKSPYRSLRVFFTEGMNG